MTVEYGALLLKGANLRRAASAYSIRLETVSRPVLTLIVFFLLCSFYCLSISFASLSAALCSVPRIHFGIWMQAAWVDEEKVQISQMTK